MMKRAWNNWRVLQFSVFVICYTSENSFYCAYSAAAGPGDTTAFVHRGRQHPDRMTVPGRRLKFPPLLPDA